MTTKNFSSLSLTSSYFFLFSFLNENAFSSSFVCENWIKKYMYVMLMLLLLSLLHSTEKEHKKFPTFFHSFHIQLQRRIIVSEREKKCVWERKFVENAMLCCCCCCWKILSMLCRTWFFPLSHFLSYVFRLSSVQCEKFYPLSYFIHHMDIYHHNIITIVCHSYACMCAIADAAAAVSVIKVFSFLCYFYFCCSWLSKSTNKAP